MIKLTIIFAKVFVVLTACWLIFCSAYLFVGWGAASGGPLIWEIPLAIASYGALLSSPFAGGRLLRVRIIVGLLLLPGAVFLGISVLDERFHRLVPVLTFVAGFLAYVLTYVLLIRGPSKTVTHSPTLEQ